jgi:hypothetical protein
VMNSPVYRKVCQSTAKITPKTVSFDISIERNKTRLHAQSPKIAEAIRTP